MNALRSITFNLLYIFGSLFWSIALLWALFLPPRRCTEIIIMPITEELLVEFLLDHEIDDADDLEEFSEMVHLLFAEPNVPYIVLN